MKLQTEKQRASITDATRSRIALALPILKGMLFALKRDRVTRLGGYDKITLEDLGREYREGDGDCGICFEYAVHDALLAKDPMIYERLSTVLEDYCGIKTGAQSILFGAEKTGAISLIETSQDLVNADSRILSGKIGQPAKLQKQWATIKQALRETKARDRLPNSIKGLWKADLFLGSSIEGRWVGSTLKLNKPDFEAAAGLRIGIYPEEKPTDRPKKDVNNNLVLCPLPYDNSFMEVFNSTFLAVKMTLLEDTRLPKPVKLPNSADRFMSQQLVDRRDFTVLDIIEAMYPLGQVNLIDEGIVGSAKDDDSIPLDAVAPCPATT